MLYTKVMRRHQISFKNAFVGIWTAIQTQINLRIHFLLASLTLILGTALGLSLSQLVDLLLVIALVITAELFNTALEFACDAITLEQHPLIKMAKDISAGAVLFTSLFAVTIGLIIFVPKILALL